MMKNRLLGTSKNCHFVIAACEKPLLCKDLHAAAGIKRWVFRCSLLTVLLIAAGFLLVPPTLFSQDGDGYRPVSLDRLREVLTEVKTWTAETIAFRENARNLTAKEIVEQANAIRKKFDPVMVLMATTKPPEQYQLAATLLLMGTKGVELSLWHYILAAAANAANSMAHGDTLLQTAVNQINDAEKLFAK